MTVGKISAVVWVLWPILGPLCFLAAIEVWLYPGLPVAVRIALFLVDLLVWWAPFVYAMYLSVVVVKNGDRRLLRRGKRGTAVVVSRERTGTVIQTGQAAWEAPRVYKYRLDVSLPGRRTYRTIVRICDRGYVEGSTVTVFAAPHNRKRVYIEPPPTSATPGVRAPGRLGSAVANASRIEDATPGTAWAGARIQALSRLAELREQGFLTDAEFTAAKARILNE